MTPNSPCTIPGLGRMCTHPVADEGHVPIMCLVPFSDTVIGLLRQSQPSFILQQFQGLTNDSASTRFHLQLLASAHEHTSHIRTRVRGDDRSPKQNQAKGRLVPPMRACWLTVRCARAVFTSYFDFITSTREGPICCQCIRTSSDAYIMNDRYDGHSANLLIYPALNALYAQNSYHERNYPSVHHSSRFKMRALHFLKATRMAVFAKLTVIIYKISCGPLQPEIQEDLLVPFLYPHVVLILLGTKTSH